MINNNVITFDEFAEYLNKQSGSHLCPICGGEAWDLHTPENAVVTSADGKTKKHIVPTLPGSNRIDSKSPHNNQLLQTPILNLLVMTCSNCGYINLFNYQIVKESIEKSLNENCSAGKEDELTEE
ncbi:hypothetical protein AB6F89_15505 [Providencia hangzhouensis]|uniref:hypothetical protein n=1 Tax=Providencia hangzhouensis TaxID=3031799 RepID=UPI0034DCC7E8